MVPNANLIKPLTKLWTYQHPSASRYQVDYILIWKKWRNSIRNCQSYSTFSSIGSDHRIASCTICLSLRSSKRPDVNPTSTGSWFVRNQPSFNIFLLMWETAMTPFHIQRTILRQSIKTSVNVPRWLFYQLCPKRRSKNSRHWTLTFWFKREMLSSPPENNVRLTHHRSHFERSKSSETAWRSLRQCWSRTYPKQNWPAATQDHQQATAWDTIKDLTGRKSNHPLIRANGGSASERKRTGYTTSKIFLVQTQQSPMTRSYQWSRSLTPST